jgi:CDP-glucose 4,6-dehydratase
LGEGRGPLEEMVIASAPSPSFWKGRKVFLTGHTGFKGSWLALWLREMGASVTGYALDPASDPSLCMLAGVPGECAADIRGDICAPLLRQSLEDSGAEIVLHLAAQPLVRESYRDPRETWRVNVMGTLNLLEACRACASVQTIVVVTTDKVYENPEQGLPFKEQDPLGGYDPYSSSKAACEILCASWRRSFLEAAGGRTVGLATARAGNVVGGGDFAADRLIPDLVRARRTGANARLRYPAAVRPWQHVLEPLAGYLVLAERLHEDARAFAGAFNFGPDKTDFRPVGEVADRVCAALGSKWEREDAPQPHEAGLLTLDSSLAETRLGWMPRLAFADTLVWTAGWYADWLNGGDPRALTLSQIRTYSSLPAAGGHPARS